jgi:hypothetical protein
MKFFLGLLLLASEAQGVQFWGGTLSYDPPFSMVTNESPWLVTFSTLGLSVGSNGVAEVRFSLAPIHPPAPTTIASLKRFFDSQSSLGGNYYSTDIIKVGGKEAVMCTVKTNTTPHGPSKWQCTVTFFWEQTPAGQNSLICTINMAAESRDTLGLLTNSLKTVKLVKTEEVVKSEANKPQMVASNPLLGKWYIDPSSADFEGDHSAIRGVEFQTGGRFVTFGYNFTIHGAYTLETTNRVRLESKEISGTSRGKQVTENVGLPVEFRTRIYRYDELGQELVEEDAMISAFRFRRTPPK